MDTEEEKDEMEEETEETVKGVAKEVEGRNKEKGKVMEKDGQK